LSLFVGNREQECAGKAVNHTILLVSRIPIAYQFVAVKGSPMLLESVSFSFQVTPAVAGVVFSVWLAVQIFND